VECQFSVENIKGRGHQTSPCLVADKTWGSRRHRDLPRVLLRGCCGLVADLSQTSREVGIMEFGLYRAVKNMWIGLLIKVLILRVCAVRLRQQQVGFHIPSGTVCLTS